MIRELAEPTLRLMKATVRRDRRQFAALAFWSLVEALPAFASGHAVARALDDGFLAGKPLVGLAWLGAFAAAAMCGAIGIGKIVPRLGAIVEPLRDALVRRVVGGTIQGTGDRAVVARLTQQVELIRDSFAGLIMVVRDFSFTTASAVAGLLTLLPVTVPLVVAPLVVSVALFVRILLAMAPRQGALVLADEQVATEAGILVDGVRDAVASGAEAAMAASADAVIDAQAQAARDVAKLTAISTLCLAVGGWLPVILLLAFAPWLLRGGASTGDVLGVAIFVMYGVQPALRSLVHGLGGTGLRLVVTVHRLLEMTAPRKERDGWGSRQVWQHGNDVVAEHLTFAYGRRSEPVIRDLTLRLPDGDHLAVVGPSGIGKSTLALLLAGVLQPDRGQVTLAGAPLPSFEPELLVRRRVLIPQEAYVFTATLADNLRYLNPHADQAQLAEAALAVGLDLPLDLTLDPVRLSPPERQLIALTRAYVSPARFVILDEATCHLSPEAEARAEEAFAARPGTLMVIAHRMSSALRAQRVLVLDGAHATLGTHEDLLEHSALYRDLIGHWNA